MSNLKGAQTVDAAIKFLCGSSVSGSTCTCGSCTYDYVNGMYQRVGAGNCGSGCGCPSAITPLAAHLTASICRSAIVTSNTATFCCTSSTLSTLPDGDLEARLVDLFKSLLAGYRFWKLVSAGLAMLSVVLVGVVVYLLTRG